MKEGPAPRRRPHLGQSTPRARVEKAFVRALYEHARVRGGAADCWLLPSGRCFTRQDPGRENGGAAVLPPLHPGRTLVVCRPLRWNHQWAFGLDHQQVYLGRGYCLSFRSDDSVTLVRLPVLSDVALQFSLHHVPVPAAGLAPTFAKAEAALGVMPWLPRQNCHTLSAWVLLPAVAPGDPPSAVADTLTALSVAAGAVVLCLLVLVACRLSAAS